MSHLIDYKNEDKLDPLSRKSNIPNTCQKYE